MSDKPVCAKCGQVHERCSAHKRKVRPLKPCMQFPNKGLTVCRSHGGASAKARAAGKRRIEEQKQEAAARKVLATYGQPINQHPVEALLNLIYWSAGHVEWLRQRVQETSPDDLVWGQSEHSVKVGGEDHGEKTTETASPSVWLKLYNEERRILADLCNKAVAAGIEERKIQLAERYVDYLFHFRDVFANRILLALAARGWDRSELEEVWPGVVEEGTRRALTTMKAAAEAEDAKNANV